MHYGGATLSSLVFPKTWQRVKNKREKGVYYEN